MTSERFKKIIPVLLGILFLADILAWVAVFDLSQPHLLEVSFFDVGQGDSIFIETPQRHQILIDGGPDSMVLEKLGKEMPFWDRTIDLVILTHPDFDHLNGLIEVLNSYEVENILWTGIVSDKDEYNEWLDVMKKEKAKVTIAEAGQKIKSGGVYLEIIYPFDNLNGRRVENANNSSVVSRLVFGETSFLFLGDIYQSVEKEIAEKNGNSDSDVLKISHHGSKYSSNDDFIKKVSPEIGVISVGKDNNYGHPSQETLETLGKYGINILRTDLEGDIKIISNGKEFVVR